MKRAIILLAAVLGAVVLYVDLTAGKFRDRIDRERDVVLGSRIAGPSLAANAQKISGLPEPVKKYLHYALGGRKDPVASVRIKQSGSFRMNEKDAWTPVAADHLLALGQPSFVWQARIQPHPYVWTEGRDLLHEGTGRTEHRLYSAFPFPVQRYSGKAVDVSALVRYLSEAPWLPAALLPGKHLTWKAVNAETARAVLTFNGYQVSADFTFNKEGEIVRVTTGDRSLFRSGSTEAHRWSASYKRYEQHGGIRIPMEMDAEWNINGKSFPYAKLRVESIVFENI